MRYCGGTCHTLQKFLFYTPYIHVLKNTVKDNAKRPWTLRFKEKWGWNGYVVHYRNSYVIPTLIHLLKEVPWLALGDKRPQEDGGMGVQK